MMASPDRSLPIALLKVLSKSRILVFPPKRDDMVLTAPQLAREFLHQLNVRFPPTVKGNGTLRQPARPVIECGSYIPCPNF